MPQGLLPQDVVVLARVVSYGGERPPIAQVAGDLALKRLERSRLIDAETGRPLLKAVEEFLIHGVKYVFPVQRSEATLGMPTSCPARPLSDQIADNDDLPPCGQIRKARYAAPRSSHCTRPRRRLPKRTPYSANSWR
jgi:hypothetical protein